MSVLRHLRVLVIALGATGCIAFIQPIDVGDDCKIAGSSPCATCIRQSCQKKINDCCGAESCGLGYTTAGGVLGSIGSVGKSDILEVVDKCGGGDNTTCASKLSTKRSGAEEEAVRTCVASSCNAECLGGAGTGVDNTDVTWTCDAPRDGAKSCGACLYSKCAKAVTGCCGDSTCSGDTFIQKLIGACAVAEDPALCTYRLHNQSTSGFGGVLSNCLAEQCNAPCLADGRSHTECNLESGGLYCACTDAAKSGGPTCEKKSGTHCALQKDGCTCGAYKCSHSSDACRCDLHGSGEDTSCALSNSSVGKCCVTIDISGVRCKCDRYVSSCSSTLGESEVSSCDEDVFLTKIDNLLVDSCSH